MTAATQIAQIPPQSPSHGFTLSPEQSALALEIGKCLKLVAPAGMGADAQMSWIGSAIDALDGIRANEVAAISAELRRSVTRPAQIVPEIARLVADRRRSMSNAGRPDSPHSAECAIDREASDRRAKAKTREEIQDAWAWECQARKDAALAVPPLQPPLTRDELDYMSADMASLGLKYGHLERREGRLVETGQ